MANVFKNAYKDGTTSLTDLIAALDSNHEAILLMLRATNVDGTNDATVDVRVVDSDGSNDSYIAKTMSVPADTSLDLLGSGKLVLDAGDSLKVLASTAGDIEFFASYLEITD
tara:strand:+ start:23 stop:358 length:336 start_codon:yes stop_codon:yes gene_type:complete